MTTTINAVSGTGLTQTSDGSGIVKLQSNGVATNALAWANFGYVSSAITIRSSYNVSSVTRNGTGDYTINFSNAMSDANYATIGSTNSGGSSNVNQVFCIVYVPTTTAVRINTVYGTNNVAYDMYSVNFAVFGN